MKELSFGDMRRRVILLLLRSREMSLLLAFLIAGGPWDRYSTSVQVFFGCYIVRCQLEAGQGQAYTTVTIT